MIKKIHHASLTVNNLEKEIEFFETLGFEVKNRFKMDEPVLKGVYLSKKYDKHRTLLVC